MAINELTRLVAPPDAPIDAGPTERRTSIESELGLALPNDVFDFALAYGSGTFSKHQFWIHNPFAPGYVASIRNLCDLFRGIKNDLGDAHIPYDYYPDAHGLFPWGSEDNGHEMYWLMDGNADNWPIVLYRNRSPDDDRWQRWDLPITTFLARLYTGEIDSNILSSHELLAEFEPQ